MKFVPPTRSNYLRVAHSLHRARQGYELLERKRQILVLELMSKVEGTRVIQKRVEEAMAQAHAALQRAAAAAGAERLVRESCAVPTTHRLNITTRSVMGVDVPDVHFTAERPALPFGLLAGAEGAREVKRTQRRVNALEKNFIPQYEETLKFIRDCLQEREREDLVVMKKVKRVRQAALHKTGDQPAARGRHG
jgi:V/A-type H+-transporting ATPase subunit D